MYIHNYVNIYDFTTPALICTSLIVMSRSLHSAHPHYCNMIPKQMSRRHSGNQFLPREDTSLSSIIFSFFFADLIIWQYELPL